MSLQLAEERLHTYLRSARQDAKALENAIKRIPVRDEIKETKSISPLGVGSGGAGVQFGVAFQNDYLPLHRNAGRQLAEQLGIPAGWSQEWLDTGGWRTEVIADVLSTAWVNGEKKRLLMREHDGQVKAVLSDRYRRLEPSSLIEGFLEGTMKADLIPLRVRADDLRWSIEVAPISPMLITLPQGLQDYVVPLFSLSSSDFGVGALELRWSILRLLCKNGMVGASLSRQVHLGRQIPKEIILMEDTMKADTRASALLLRDTLASNANTEAIERMMLPIRSAAAEVLEEPKEYLGGLVRARRISQQQSEKVESLLLQRDPNVIPEGPVTRWTIGQGLSYLAQGATDLTGAIELERSAYRVISEDWKEE